jgi:MFS family permease
MVSDRRARVALLVMFGATGFFVGSWAARIPAVKSEFGLSAGRLGLLLACMTVGAMAVSPLAGYLSTRLGSRVLLRAAAPAMAIAFLAVALAPTALALAAALLVYGAVNGLVQVSINAQAITLEERYRRPLLSSLHGGFSIGMMAGALIAAPVAYLGVSYRTHLSVVALVMLAVGVAIGFFLLDLAKTARPQYQRIRLSLPLVVIIVVAFFELFCEGAASSWSSVYIRDSIGASSALAALAFGLYALTMTAGRLGGDRLVTRMGVGGVVRAGGVIAAAGMALALLLPEPLVALAGFALFGLGLSCLAPTLFRAAGQLPLPEGQGIAALVGAAWPAFLLVAPVIGGLAQVTSLRAALLLAVGSALAMVSLSGGLGRLAPSPIAASEPEY